MLYSGLWKQNIQSMQYEIHVVTLVNFNFGKSIFVHSFSSFNISLLTTFFHKNVVQAVIFFDNLNAYYDFCDSDD